MSQAHTQFFLNDGKAIYLVTAKHVLFKKKQDPTAPQAAAQQTPSDLTELRSGTGTLISYSKDPADESRNVFSLDFSALLAVGNLKPHPTQDVAVVRIFTISVPLEAAIKPGGAFLSVMLPGVVLRQSAKAGSLDVALNSLKTFNQVLTGNDVMVFGYPRSIGLQNLPQIDYQRPLLRKGIVSGTNPAKKTIILDCAVYPGNSGGPVLEVDRDGLGASFKIIGIVSEYVPFDQSAGSETIGITVLGNSGYSVAAPMDFVLELLKQ